MNKEINIGMKMLIKDLYFLGHRFLIGSLSKTNANSETVARVCHAPFYLSRTLDPFSD